MYFNISNGYCHLRSGRAIPEDGRDFPARNASGRAGIRLGAIIEPFGVEQRDTEPELASRMSSVLSARLRRAAIAARDGLSSKGPETSRDSSFRPVLRAAGNDDCDPAGESSEYERRVRFLRQDDKPRVQEPDSSPSFRKPLPRRPESAPERSGLSCRTESEPSHPRDEAARIWASARKNSSSDRSTAENQYEIPNYRYPIPVFY